MHVLIAGEAILHAVNWLARTFELYLQYFQSTLAVTADEIRGGCRTRGGLDYYIYNYGKITLAPCISIVVTTILMDTMRMNLKSTTL